MKKFKFISYLFIMIMSLGILCSCSGEMGPQGPQGEQGIQGAQGEQGQPGKDGTSLLTGNGEPTNVIGIVGDSYIDLDTWSFYIKTTNGWIISGNIKGEKGDSIEPDHNGTEGLEFYPINETECAVAVGNAKLLKEIVIPSKYKQYTVTTIYGNTSQDAGFFQCKKLESIKIPNSVTTIGAYAFYYCTSLTNIVIPEGVTSIGISAFAHCSSLTSIQLPSTLTSIGGSAFYSCNSLTSIELPSTLTSIISSAFSGCSSLTSIVIPEGVTSIGGNAFSYCSSLTSIQLPSTLTSIGNHAFSDCSSLTSIVIPEDVTSIGYSAFAGCTNLSIFCKTSKAPNGWSSEWKDSNVSVYWTEQWEYDDSGNPVPLN